MMLSAIKWMVLLVIVGKATADQQRFSNVAMAGVQANVEPPRRPQTPIADTREPVINCRATYDLLPGIGCYKLFFDCLSWKDALDACVADGAQLAVPETKEQMDYFSVKADRPGGNTPWAWLGINRTDEHWITVEGSEFPLNSSFWALGEPGSMGDCVNVYLGGLMNVNCAYTNRYICSLPPS